MEGAAGPAIQSAPDDRRLGAGADLEKPCLGYLIVTAKARFVEPMLLQRCADLPEGSAWLHELKLDGFRAIAFKSAGKVYLRSRNDKDFNGRYPEVVNALSGMPDETVIDGEIVALDGAGRPSFNVLQNYGSGKAPVFYYVFDLLVAAGEDVMGQTLDVRRELLEDEVLPKLKEPVRYSPELKGRMVDLIQSVKAQGLEGLIAKRRNSRYEPGQRSGAWQKMRVNQGQDFVIGGYTIGGATFDALVYGYYEGKDLIYAARTRNGFTPKLRAELMKKLKPLEIDTCPFTNLPETHAGRWGAGLTAKKMADCHWVKPLMVGQFEFVEWTPEGHLRHSSFVGLREDKKAKDVRRK
jgi:DNA ligase D-like protein (predicted ligase)